MGAPGARFLRLDCGGSSGPAQLRPQRAHLLLLCVGLWAGGARVALLPGQTVFPLPPAGMTYPGAWLGPTPATRPSSCHRGARPHQAGQPSGAQLAAAAAGSLGCSKPAGSSPLAGASPPSVMTASLCRDPYCLSYHCASHLAGAAAASVVRSRSGRGGRGSQVRIPAGVPHAPAARRALIAHRGRGRRRHTAPGRPPSTPTASCSLTTRSPTSATGCRPTGLCDSASRRLEELGEPLADPHGLP